ncbi:MAG: iron chelate uptake ABC transporter family permease subunit, partial [Firmicutes bacterium]|nr:iron chelate uptake ABC transporter family permease subunit [Bacillota bacterium]
LCNELDVLALGEETAVALGLSVKKLRTLFLILAALLAGATVSFAGLLGFVGLIVPHAVRKLVGSESRQVLPLCILGGAGFVTVCDLLARVMFAPYELPVGILMSILGGPFFLLLLIKRRGGRAHA